MRKRGSAASPAGSTATETTTISSAVTTAPATTTRERKRMAAIAAGTTSQASAGLRAPPVSAAATARTTEMVSRFVTTARSGRSVCLIRQSSVPLATIATAKPDHGAVARIPMPMAAAATARARLMRGVMSSTRARSRSVGQSQPAIYQSLDR